MVDLHDCRLFVGEVNGSSRSLLLVDNAERTDGYVSKVLVIDEVVLVECALLSFALSALRFYEKNDQLDALSIMNMSNHDHGQQQN